MFLFLTETLKQNRGQALLLVLLVLVVVALIGGILIRYTVMNIDFASRQKSNLAAEQLALSGLDYAAYQISCGNWLDRERPFHVVRRLGGGKADIRVSDRDSATLQVECTGSTPRGPKKRLRMFMGNPETLTKHLLCVFNYDVRRNRFIEDSVIELGSGNVGANSITEEPHLLTESGIVNTHAPGDPYFGGIVPGSTYVVDDSGAEFALQTGGTLSPGHYAVDYRNGSFLFDASDEGRNVSVFYDYYRQIPLAPNPFVASLPWAPLRRNSEHVWGLDGVPFWRSHIMPTVQANYMVDYDRGRVHVSEFDSGRPIRVSYAFLGSKHTGPIHVNGDISWHHTNQCFLFNRRGDRISASGGFRYDPGSTVALWTEERYVSDVRSANDLDLVYAGGVPEISPPLYNLSWVRKQADHESGGSGWYLDNSADIEYPEMSSPELFDDTQRRLFQEWQSRVGSYWEGSVYNPPGVEIDLSQLPADEPVNGLIFAEGNMRVRGRVPEGRRLTLVSGNNIYIDGNIWRKGGESSVGLIAEKNICINLTKSDNQGISGDRQEFYVNALLWARRGTLGVIPSLSKEHAGILYGAIGVNTVYPNEEWGRGFYSLDYVFDSSYASGRSRPPYLASVLRIEANR